MRFASRVCGTILSFAAAIWLVPVLHECGHLVAAWATGGGVTEYGMLPRLYVSLRVGGEAERMLFVGVCGGWFPLLLLLLPDRGSFYLYAVKTAVAVTGFFCAAVSTAYGVIYLVYGTVNEYDDAVILLRQFPDKGEIVFLSLGIQAVVSAGFLFRTHLLKRMTDHFSMTKKQQAKPVYVIYKH